MADELSGKHVVVTGGRGALGAVVVELLVGKGAVCHLPERGSVDPGASSDRVRVTGGIDLTDEAAVTGFYQALPRAPWASVHAAGAFTAAPITSTSAAQVRAQFEINLVTAFLCCRESVRAMRKAGMGGRIVNVASRAALEPGAGTLAYTAAKAALVALTEGLAVEVRSDGILVNAIAPAVIDTPKNRADMPNANWDTWASPAAIAQTVLWLVSPANTLTSGAIVPVYGQS